MSNYKPKNCKMCGKEFIPNSPSQVYCKNPHYRNCPVCGKEYIETNYDKLKHPPTTCSMECRTRKREQTSIAKYGISTPGNNPMAREKSRQTMLERYGVEHAQQSEGIKQKSKETYITKYGVDNPQKCNAIKEKTKSTNLTKYGSTSYLNSDVGKKQIESIMMDKYGTIVPLRNDDIKQQWIQTNLDKYGVDNPAKSAIVRNKMQQTSMERYGTLHPQSSEIVKQHTKDTFIRNYGVDSCFKSKDIIDKIQKSFFEHYGVHSVMEAEEIASRIRETNMKKYGVPYYVMLPSVAKSSGRISKINQKISDKLHDMTIPHSMEYTVGDQSYDIYVPHANLLIEIDPTYTHSTVGNHWNPNGISIDYHLNKTNNAIEHGYRCIHLWDWDCPSKFINSLVARNIIYSTDNPQMIDKAEAESFNSKFSMYDYATTNQDVTYIGIKYRSKLMMVIGFELIDPFYKVWRMSSIEQRFGYTVHAGIQKILQMFESEYAPSKIIAYADLSKSSGELLETAGFQYLHNIPPNRIWSKGKHAIVDDTLIIETAMLSDKWLPVYNCGYKVYEK